MMNLFLNLSSAHPIPHAIWILSLVAVTGLLLGRFNIYGIGLGIAGVLFSGIALGHLGFEIDHQILDFTREFGLVLFVYTIGIQVGPGFFTSLRQQGLSLNMLALLTVILSASVALLIGHWLHFPMAAIVGLFSGATTNTPSLGAAQEALKSLPHVSSQDLALPGLAYAAAYPFGIIGIILTMLFMRWIFRIDPKKEAVAFEKARGQSPGELERLTIKITQDLYAGKRLGDIPPFKELKIVVTRIYHGHDGTISTPFPTTPIQRNDILLAVGDKESLDALCQILGEPSPVDLMKEAGQLHYRSITVTKKNILGKTVRELNLEPLYGVTASRVTRADLEMTAVPDLHLQFGDQLRIVGTLDQIKQVTAYLGNSKDAIHHTPFIPVFLGILLGVLAGSLPLQIPGLPAPITLGLAGGPLVVAILLGRIRRIGPLNWYMSMSADLALREMGIILFLACVGLKAGTRFFDILWHGDGLVWMACASAITIIPLLVIGWLARMVLKCNFMTICGVLSGTMTDPPALAFANNISGSDAPSVAYATVYPLTMLMRILTAQILVLMFS